MVCLFNWFCFLSIWYYTITEILRAVIGRCLLSIRGQMHEWRHCVAWPARVIKVHRRQSSGKDFQNSGPKQSEKYSLLVEDFSEKETAQYQSQWEAFNSAKHARSLPGKKLSKAAWKLCCRKVCRRRGKSTNADEWQNMVRTSVTHSAPPRGPLLCCYHILTSSVICNWTDARQNGIYLLNSSSCGQGSY